MTRAQKLELDKKWAANEETKKKLPYKIAKHVLEFAHTMGY